MSEWFSTLVDFPGHFRLNGVESETGVPDEPAGSFLSREEHSTEAVCSLYRDWLFHIAPDANAWIEIQLTLTADWPRVVPASRPV